MEPMTLFFYIIIFWIPSILFLLSSILIFRRILLRKISLFIFMVLFLIPFILILINRIDDKIKTNEIVGSYIGKDISSKEITIEITNNNKFSIQVNKCKKANRIGTWQYVSDYDAFIFHLNNNEIYIQKNHKGEYILTSNIISDCCNLKEITLSKLKL